MPSCCCIALLATELASAGHGRQESTTARPPGAGAEARRAISSARQEATVGEEPLERQRPALVELEALLVSLIGALPGADGGDDAPCFERRLGAATGATMSGVGFGVRGIVPIAQRTIDTAGWRTAYLVLAALALLTPVAVLALVRDRPEEVGQLPDGRAPGTDLDPAGVAGSVVSRRSPQDGWSLPRAARTWRFWLMLAAFAAMYFTSQAVFVLQVALLTDVGSSVLFAASVAGLIGGTRVIGNLGRPLRSSRT